MIISPQPMFSLILRLMISLIPCFLAQPCITRQIYSGPLSQRMCLGFPLHSILWSKDRITRSDGKEISTSIPCPSRLKSSNTLKVLNALPSVNRCDIKSIDHTSLGQLGTFSVSGISRQAEWEDYPILVVFEQFTKGRSLNVELFYDSFFAALRLCYEL